jgi:hypothetical protein
MIPTLIPCIVETEICTISICEGMLTFFTDAVNVNSASSSAALLAEFLMALKSAVERNGVITLQCSEQAMKLSQLLQNNSGASKLMLLRDAYKDLFGKIMGRFEKGETLSDQVCIMGTAGIGKSFFRYFVLRIWLRDEIEIPFQSVLINMDEVYFVVRKDPAGNVEVTSVASDWRDMNALALLDPCSILNGKTLMFKLLVITTSSSPLTEQSKICSLSERFKLCSSYVMSLWSLKELLTINPKIDEDILRKFSFVENEITYCVPRWIFYTAEEVQLQLDDCVSHAKMDALQSWLLSDPEDRLKDHVLPFHLCVIRPGQGTRWEAYRFLSDWICEFVLKKVVTHSRPQRSQLLNMIKNPFARGLFETMFENWAFALLRKGISLSIPEIPGTEFHFSVAGHLEARKGKVQTRNKVIYRAAPGYPSIDGFGVDDQTLVFIQATVSPTHSDTEWSHIEHIVASAGKLAKSAFMVYLVPTGTTFTLPSCPTLLGHKLPFTICRGEILSDCFYKDISEKFNIRVQDSVESVGDVEARAQYLRSGRRRAGQGGN